ncbi:unnamed protein product [Spirodela intermedia]|uniref:NPH3 domain-containing protein n=1 Tax=Spirodela intermedia TaxID=51605 RepID=A0A7I8JRF1_SPIIN|nr:unnamed protein product [Spirodela intermedia]CAA6672699.1 unnamed protein product [Spirodela intermedia]
MRSPGTNLSQRRGESAERTALRRPAEPGTEPWLDEKRLLDMDNFVKTLAEAKSKGIHPELAGSVIPQFAANWLSELSGGGGGGGRRSDETPSEGSIAAWMKKRFLVETLVGLLPPEKDSLPCSFLLRLLRTANMVGAEPTCLADLEARVARQLDQATLRELMIPAFSHTCGTLLDVQLVLRLVRGFVSLDEAVKSGAAIAKVSKLLDAYLAEAAIDTNLSLPDFQSLAASLPAHSRASDDGLYRAIDTYLKAHAGTGKEERRELWKLIDTRKLSSEAALHATQNQRLPVRAVMEVLFSEYGKLSRPADWSGSLSGPAAPREVIAQQQEIRRLRDDVGRLQLQCHALQVQMDRLVDRKKRGGGIFKWRSLLFKQIDMTEEQDVVSSHTPLVWRKGRPLPARTPTPRWRNSLS